jgi:hypothetical protein
MLICIFYIFLSLKLLLLNYLIHILYIVINIEISLHNHDKNYSHHYFFIYNDFHKNPIYS